MVDPEISGHHEEDPLDEVLSATLSTTVVDEDEPSLEPTGSHGSNNQSPNTRQRRRGKKRGKRAPDDIHPGLIKYWNNRYEYFSKFDQGIKLDQESWYSVTPEKIAIQQAQKCATGGVILDAFCGCGGNTIQFAKYCHKVIAVDIDPVKIEYARHNAEVYGVAEKIEFICSDFMSLAASLEADVVFLSPPWGGPLYKTYEKFDLESMIPMGGFKVFDKARLVSEDIAYFLPRNIDEDQVDELASSRGLKSVEIMSHKSCGRILSKTLFFGGLCGRPPVQDKKSAKRHKTTAKNPDSSA